MTKRAEVYPGELCRDILAGLVNQMQHDGRIGSSFTLRDQSCTREEILEDMEIHLKQLWQLDFFALRVTRRGRLVLSMLRRSSVMLFRKRVSQSHS